ncbi:MAG TPA: T9SS type A sorting domain-containing protein [Chitinophagaceae bacterium]|nr:T9SS type A sorting domain-containing protein [Chitinophagaceae bacterium]
MAEAQYGLPHATAKTTGTPERVIASAGYESGHIPDSSTYEWSADRCSKAVPGVWYQVSIQDYDKQTFWFMSSGTATLQSRKLQTYDVLGNVTAYLLQTWDAGSSSWLNYEQTLTTYSGKLLLESVQQQWDKGAGKWMNYLRIQHIYSGTDLAQSNTDTWLSSSSSWLQSRETQFDYSGGYLVMQTEKIWNTSAASWDSFQKTSYENYIGGIASKRSIYDWNSAVKTWEGNTQFISTYSGGKISSDSIFSWQKSAHYWRLAQSSQRSYTGSDLVRYDRKIWDASLGRIIPEVQAFYHYTGTNPDTMLYQAWDESSLSWGYTARNIYEYNSNGSLTYTCNQVLNGENWEDPNAARHYYYEPYSTTSALSATPRTRPVKLYPNPVGSTHVYLDYSTSDAAPVSILLTDLAGTTLYRIDESGSIGDHSVRIPVSTLASGVYFVQLISNGLSYSTMKLIR